jgi:uncharacterized protein
MAGPGRTTRRVAWSKVEGAGGAEWAEVHLTADRLSATGVAIGGDPLAYRLDYSLETSTGYVTTRLVVATEGDGWRRGLDLRRSDAGSWTAVVTASDGERTVGASLRAAGADTTTLRQLDAALDCDLGLCPVTNTMPVLRHDLLDGGAPVSFVMAWVSVPDLAVLVSHQRYTPLEAGAPPDRPRARRVIRYESGTYHSDLTFDEDGLVIDYPGLARRL